MFRGRRRKIKTKKRKFESFSRCMKINYNTRRLEIQLHALMVDRGSLVSRRWYWCCGEEFVLNLRNIIMNLRLDISSSQLDAISVMGPHPQVITGRLMRVLTGPAGSFYIHDNNNGIDDKITVWWPQSTVQYQVRSSLLSSTNHPRWATAAERTTQSEGGDSRTRGAMKLAKFASMHFALLNYLPSKNKISPVCRLPHPRLPHHSSSHCEDL